MLEPGVDLELELEFGCSMLMQHVSSFMLCCCCCCCNGMAAAVRSTGSIIRSADDAQCMHAHARAM